MTSSAAFGLSIQAIVRRIIYRWETLLLTQQGYHSFWSEVHIIIIAEWKLRSKATRAGTSVVWDSVCNQWVSHSRISNSSTSFSSSALTTLIKYSLILRLLRIPHLSRNHSKHAYLLSLWRVAFQGPYLGNGISSFSILKGKMLKRIHRKGERIWRKFEKEKERSTSRSWSYSCLTHYHPTQTPTHRGAGKFFSGGRCKYEYKHIHII